MSGKICVMMSGLPGDMATKAAQEIAKQPDMELAVYALTGPKKRTRLQLGTYTLELVGPEYHSVALIVKNIYFGTFYNVLSI